MLLLQHVHLRNCGTCHGFTKPHVLPHPPRISKFAHGLTNLHEISWLETGLGQNALAAFNIMERMHPDNLRPTADTPRQNGANATGRTNVVNGDKRHMDAGHSCSDVKDATRCWLGNTLLPSCCSHSTNAIVVPRQIIIVSLPIILASLPINCCATSKRHFPSVLLHFQPIRFASNHSCFTSHQSLCHFQSFSFHFQ